MNHDAFEKGLKTRREVLGAEYVDQSIRNADAFNLPLQELVTEYCWNEIWNRPGLIGRPAVLLIWRCSPHSIAPTNSNCM